MQCQKGLSLGKFLQRYGSEGQCEQAVFNARRPDGFRCPECGSRRHCRIRSRKLWQCHACHRQSSLVAGTIFAATKLPLTVWLLAIHLLTQGQHGVSSLELARQLGVSRNTAWKVQHKLLPVLKERDERVPLGGIVQVDDAYWGGERSCGDSRFVRVNTMLAHVKQSLAGTCHALDGKHLPRYLAEFRYRFNRRYHLEALVPRLLHASVRTPPRPCRLLTLAESRG